MLLPKYSNTCIHARIFIGTRLWLPVYLIACFCTSAITQTCIWTIVHLHIYSFANILNHSVFCPSVQLHKQILRQTKPKELHPGITMVNLSLFVRICLFYTILSRPTFAFVNRRTNTWCFFGIFQPNGSEGIFATANSKVCFQPPEIFSVAQNDRPEGRCFWLRSRKILNHAEWMRPERNIEGGGNPSSTR